MKLRARFNNIIVTFDERDDIDIRALMAEAYKDTPDPIAEHALPSDEKNIALQEENASDEEFDKLMEEAAEIHEEDSIHKAFYKVFKQLAKKLHPDRQPREMPPAAKEENMKLFKKARDALDDQRYFVLLDLAEQYNIELPTNYKEQSKWMSKEMKKVQNQIHDQRQTANYIFSECDTDTDRDELVKMVLREHYNYYV